MNEEGEESFDQDEFKKLLSRFEDMLEKGLRYFFEADEYEQLVEHYIDHNLITKALKVIDIAGEHYPFSVFFTLRKAQILSASNKSHDALNLLMSIESYDPANYELQMTKGGVLSQMGLSEEAIACYKKAIALTEYKDE